MSAIDNMESLVELKLNSADDYSGLCWECDREIDFARQRQRCVFCLDCVSVQDSGPFTINEQEEG